MMTEKSREIIKELQRIIEPKTEFRAFQFLSYNETDKMLNLLYFLKDDPNCTRYNDIVSFTYNLKQKFNYYIIKEDKYLVLQTDSLYEFMLELINIIRLIITPNDLVINEYPKLKRKA